MLWGVFALGSSLAVWNGRGPPGAGPAPFPVADAAAPLPRPGPDTLPILMYHRVSDRTERGDGGRIVPIDEFEAQLRYLAEAGFTAIHFADYLAIRAGTRPRPRRAIALTFDDGYDDNFANVYPLLTKYATKAVFFPIVGSIGSSGHMSWKNWSLMDPALVEAGSHSMTHPKMKGLARSKLDHELSASKAELEIFLGREITVFAFPFGSHDGAAVRAAGRAGYRVALTTERGVNRWDDDPLRLRRINVPRGLSLARLADSIGGPPPSAALAARGRSRPRARTGLGK